MNIPIAVATWAATILVVVQGVKKLPFLETLLEKWLGPYIGIILAIVTAVVAGLAQYATDGVLTGQEALEIFTGMLAAMGFHKGLSAVRDAKLAKP